MFLIIKTMVKLSELREILHKNKIRGYLHYDKKQLIVLLREEGLLPDEPPKSVKVKEEIDSKYEKLRTIRNNPPSRYFLKVWKQGIRLHSPQFTKLHCL